MTVPTVDAALHARLQHLAAEVRAAAVCAGCADSPAAPCGACAQRRARVAALNRARARRSAHAPHGAAAVCAVCADSPAAHRPELVAQRDRATRDRAPRTYARRRVGTAGAHRNRGLHEASSLGR